MDKKTERVGYPLKLLPQVKEKLQNIANMKGLTLQALLTNIINEYLDNQKE